MQLSTTSFQSDYCLSFFILCHVLQSIGNMWTGMDGHSITDATQPNGWIIDEKSLYEHSPCISFQLLSRTMEITSRTDCSNNVKCRVFFLCVCDDIKKDNKEATHNELDRIETAWEAWEWKRGTFMKILIRNAIQSSFVRMYQLCFHSGSFTVCVITNRLNAKDSNGFPMKSTHYLFIIKTNEINWFVVWMVFPVNSQQFH